MVPIMRAFGRRPILNNLRVAYMRPRILSRIKAVALVEDFGIVDRGLENECRIGIKLYSNDLRGQSVGL